MLRRAPAGQVFRGRNYVNAKLGAHLGRHHVALDPVIKADSRIETFTDDIHQVVIQGDFQVDFRIRLEKPLECRLQDCQVGSPGYIQAQQP
ncbi:hypothetical protein FQZ97_1015750 [compost metagenome]